MNKQEFFWNSNSKTKRIQYFDQNIIIDKKKEIQLSQQFITEPSNIIELENTDIPTNQIHDKYLQCMESIQQSYYNQGNFKRPVKNQFRKKNYSPTQSRYQSQTQLNITPNSFTVTVSPNKKNKKQNVKKQIYTNEQLHTSVENTQMNIATQESLLNSKEDLSFLNDSQDYQNNYNFNTNPTTNNSVTPLQNRKLSANPGSSVINSDILFKDEQQLDTDQSQIFNKKQQQNLQKPKINQSYIQQKLPETRSQKDLQRLELNYSNNILPVLKLKDFQKKKQTLNRSTSQNIKSLKLNSSIDLIKIGLSSNSNEMHNKIQLGQFLNKINQNERVTKQIDTELNQMYKNHNIDLKPVKYREFKHSGNNQLLKLVKDESSGTKQKMTQEKIKKFMIKKTDFKKQILENNNSSTQDSQQVTNSRNQKVSFNQKTQESYYQDPDLFSLKQTKYNKKENGQTLNSQQSLFSQNIKPNLKNQYTTFFNQQQNEYHNEERKKQIQNNEIVQRQFQNFDINEIQIDLSQVDITEINRFNHLKNLGRDEGTKLIQQLKKQLIYLQNTIYTYTEGKALKSHYHQIQNIMYMFPVIQKQFLNLNKEIINLNISVDQILYNLLGSKTNPNFKNKNTQEVILKLQKDVRYINQLINEECIRKENQRIQEIGDNLIETSKICLQQEKKVDYALKQKLQYQGNDYHLYNINLPFPKISSLEQKCGNFQHIDIKTREVHQALDEAQAKVRSEIQKNEEAGFRNT